MGGDEGRQRTAGTKSAYLGVVRSAEEGPLRQVREHDFIPGGLLGELDVQQDEVIRRLDELNQEIERLMRQWQPCKDTTESDNEAA